MLEKAELLKMIIGLIQANDMHLIEQEAVLNDSVCLPNQRQASQKVPGTASRRFPWHRFPLTG